MTGKRWKIRPWDDRAPFVSITTEDEEIEIGYLWVMADDPEGVIAEAQRTGKPVQVRPPADQVADLTAIIKSHNEPSVHFPPASPRPWTVRACHAGGWKGEPSLTILDADGQEVLELEPDTRRRWVAREIVETINARYP